MKKICVILAHYNGDEFKTKNAKVMSRVNFRPMLEYVTDAAKEVCDTAVIYAGDFYDEITSYFGDEISCARNVDELADLIGNDSSAMLVRGDMPCVTGQMLGNVYEQNMLVQGVTFASGKSEIEKAIKSDITENTPSEEYFVCRSRGDIAKADKIIRLRINNKLMENGVTIINPEDTYIDKSVEIGVDTVIYPGAIIKGDTIIGENCTIMGGCIIENSKIGNGVSMKISTITDSKIGDNTTVGPYAYVRPLSDIGSNVKIGDFVEVKKSVIGDGTKISHLTYVGDSKVGKNVNFGCGTVTVNYDGKNKFLTEIGDNAFIGCNTNLVSPVKVGDNAFIAAGSTITDEVPENGFAIARERQTVKEGWVKPKDRP